MSDGTVDLGLIARQQRQIMSDMDSFKDDMGVMTAILIRMDRTVSRLGNAASALRDGETA